MTDDLADIAQDVGYIRGKLDAIHESNEQAHQVIKLALEKTSMKIENVCDDMIRVQNEVASHGARITKVEGRADVIEEDQKYISGLAKFVTEHYKFVALVILSAIGIAAGWTADEILKLIGA